MKALTICQPYADLICLPDDDDRAKRVENRTWITNYRGLLLIHAGQSKRFLTADNFGIPMEDMVFGSIIGIAHLCDCVTVEDLVPGTPYFDSVNRRWPWLMQHEHLEGPYGFVLTRCRRFEKPVKYRGAQGFFDVPPDVVRDHLEKVGV